MYVDFLAIIPCTSEIVTLYIKSSAEFQRACDYGINPRIISLKVANPWVDPLTTHLSSDIIGGSQSRGPDCVRVSEHNMVDFYAQLGFVP